MLYLLIIFIKEKLFWTLHCGKILTRVDIWKT